MYEHAHFRVDQHCLSSVLHGLEFLFRICGLDCVSGVLVASAMKIGVGVGIPGKCLCASCIAEIFMEIALKCFAGVAQAYSASHTHKKKTLQQPNNGQTAGCGKVWPSFFGMQVHVRHQKNDHEVLFNVQVEGTEKHHTTTTTGTIPNWTANNGWAQERRVVYLRKKIVAP